MASVALARAIHVQQAFRCPGVQGPQRWRHSLKCRLHLVSFFVSVVGSFCLFITLVPAQIINSIDVKITRA
jgi:hypothetical protein